MRRPMLALAGALSLGLVTAAPAFAQDACDAYSTGCDEQVQEIFDETSDDDFGVAAENGELVVTGGEVVGLSAAGLAAVAAGAGLVVASRRRRTS